MRRLIVLLTLLVVSCAGVPVNVRATRTLQTTHTLLAATQDGARSLCDPVAAAVRPPQPIPACTAAAEQLGMTTMRHQAIAAALATAFDLEQKVAQALQAWTPGTLPPAGLSEMLSELQEAAETLQLVTGSPDAQRVLRILLQAIQSIRTVQLSLMEA